MKAPHVFYTLKRKGTSLFTSAASCQRGGSEINVQSGCQRGEETERDRQRQTDRQRGRDTDRHTDRDGWTDGWRERETPCIHQLGIEQHNEDLSSILSVLCSRLHLEFNVTQCIHYNYYEMAI